MPKPILIESALLHHQLLALLQRMEVDYDSRVLTQFFARLHDQVNLEDLQDFLGEEGIYHHIISINAATIACLDDPVLVFVGEAHTPCLLVKKNDKWMLEGLADEPVRLDPTLMAQLADQALQLYHTHETRSLKEIMMAVVKPRELMQLFFVSIMVALAGLLIPLANGFAFNTVVISRSSADYTQLALWLVVGLLMLVLFDWLKRIALLRLSVLVTLNSGRYIWSHLINLPLNYYERCSASDLVIPAQVLEDLREQFDIPMLSGLLSIIFAVPNVLLLLYIKPVLGLLVLGYIGVYLLWITLSVRALLPMARGIQTRTIALSDLSLQIILLMHKVRVHLAQTTVYRAWQTRFEQLRLTETRYFYRNSVMKVVSKALSLGLILMMYALFWPQVESVAVGTFVMFVTALGLIIAALEQLTTHARTITLIWPLIERLSRLMHEPNENQTQGLIKTEFEGRLEVRDLHFGYHPQQPVLQHISFAVAPGECLAIVGRSGSGKSTLLKCLAGIETIDQGRIDYDGIPLSLIRKRDFRRHCGVILQHQQLMFGSIYQNICCGRHIPLDAVKQMCIDLGMGEWIAALPMGLQTVLHGESATISGGQRQLILLARTLIRQPSLVLLDEATSALDNHHQQVVSQYLHSRGVTRIMVAHRLSTITQADSIIVMDKGQVMQVGDLRSLSSQPGLFRALQQNHPTS